MSAKKLLEGVAGLLDTAGVGAYRPDTALPANKTGIVIGLFPHDLDDVIALHAYPVSDHPTAPDSVIAIQVRGRAGTYDAALTQQAAIFKALHGLADTDLGNGVRILHMWRQSGTVLPDDSGTTTTTSDNYYCVLDVHTGQRG